MKKLERREELLVDISEHHSVPAWRISDEIKSMGYPSEILVLTIGVAINMTG